MFDANDLKCLNPKYFNIIAANEYDVTIMSWNTGHYWYLHNPEYPEKGAVIILGIPSISSSWKGEHPAASGTEHPGT